MPTPRTIPRSATGQPVAKGLWLDEQSCRSLTVGDATFTCGHCGATHSWSLRGLVISVDGREEKPGD